MNWNLKKIFNRRLPTKVDDKDKLLKDNFKEIAYLVYNIFTSEKGKRLYQLWVEEYILNNKVDNKYEELLRANAIKDFLNYITYLISLVENGSIKDLN